MNMQSLRAQILLRGNFRRVLLAAKIIRWEPIILKSI
jgi:hypothetical protein